MTNPMTTSADIVPPASAGTRVKGDVPAPVGRPYGSAASVMAAHRTLRAVHFTYVRFVLEGMPLRDAWERCLAFAGGKNDERHFARRLREICAQIRAGARAHGVERLARVALDDLLRRRFAAPPRVDPSDATVRVATTTTAADSGAAPPAPPAAALAIPTLDEWIEARCADYGIDVDFQPYGDWLAEYQVEFGDELAAASAPPAAGQGAAAAKTISELHDQAKRQALRVQALTTLDAPPAARGALQGRDEEPALDKLAPRGEQISALNALATLLAVPATLDDPVGAWCAQTIAGHLRTVGIVTIGNLADFIDVTGFRWHQRIPGLGAVRATRLVAWLAPLVDEFARPLREASLRSLHQLALIRARRVATLDPARLSRFGLVPLERLAVLPELDGRRGVFRVQAPNTFGAEDDLTAIKCWLRRYEPTPRTHRAYLHAAEVFYLWCVCVRRVPLSSLVEADLHAFRAFLASPPADWICARAVDRASDDWRPLRGPLSAASQRHLITVIGAMFTGLLQAGYISVHVVSGIKRQMKLQRPKIDVRRTFTDAQWRSIKAAVDLMPNTPASRRLRLVLELGATSGLRLSEMCTARVGQLRREAVPGAEAGEPTQDVWMLCVVGKGGKPREVVIFDDVKALIDLHQADLQALDRTVDPRARVRSLAAHAPIERDVAARSVALLAAPATAVDDGAKGLPMALAPEDLTGEGDPGLRPLIGALRAPVPRWRSDVNGVAVLDRKTPPGDAYGALDPSALYQSLKRLFARAAKVHADLEEQRELPLEGTTFSDASTHWLRHFFATSAANDGFDPFVLKDQMGHASIETTMLYVHPERRALVAQMAKLRRRG